MKNKVNKVFGISLYVLAGILFIYTAWAFTYCAGQIGDMINSGQLTFAGNEYEIINFYMSNCTQYFIFAILLTAIGFVVQKNPVIVSPTEVSTSTKVMKPNASHEDNDLDEWFEEMRSSDESGAK